MCVCVSVCVSFQAYTRRRLWSDRDQIAPCHPGGNLGGFRGPEIQKSGKTTKRMDQLAPNVHTCADSSGNGHRLKTVSSSRPKVRTWGGFRGSKMQKSGKSTKRLYRLAPNLVNICVFIWEWTKAKNK